MHIYQSTAVKPSDSGSRTTDPEQLKVLLVVSDAKIQEKTQFFMTLCGYKNISIAQSGKEALQIFSLGVQVVLMAHELPDMTGVELSKLMRLKNPFKNIPIVALKLPEESLRQKYHAVGVREFLTMQEDITELKKILHRITH